MATKVSQIFHGLKTYAAEKWETFVTYFADRKVAKLQKTEKKLPDLFAQPSHPPIPLSKRSSKVSERVTPVVNQPRPSPVNRKAQEKQLLADYTPGGMIFQQALRRAGINVDQPFDTNLQADYADAVIRHFPLAPEDDLEQILENELFRLIQTIKSSKVKTSTAPPPPPIPTHGMQRQNSTGEGWVTFDSESSIQPSQPKVIERQELAPGKVEYLPFDRELPAPTAAINWLHINRHHNRVNFGEVADEMIRQSGEAVNQYAGKSQHVANTIHLLCKAKNWVELMKYAHNLRDNQVVPFEPIIMGEIKIRLFRESLMRAIEFKMKRHPERAAAYQEASQLILHSDWNGLATNFMLRSEEFGADYVPSYVFEQLESVIPEYSVPRPKLPAPPVYVSESVAYKPPVSDFKKFERSIPARITVTDVAKKVVRPDMLGGDGRVAFGRVEQGIKNNDFYSVAEGMTYLAEDQRQPVTDNATYRAVRYRMIKERAVGQLAEKISRETSPDIREQLQDVLILVEQNQWSRLGEYDQTYQKHSGKGLFDNYLLGEIGQYNRMKTS